MDKPVVERWSMWRALALASSLLVDEAVSGGAATRDPHSRGLRPPVCVRECRWCS